MLCIIPVKFKKFPTVDGKKRYSILAIYKKNRLLYIVKQQKINDIYIYIINEIVIRNKNKKCN